MELMQGVQEGQDDDSERTEEEEMVLFEHDLPAIEHEQKPARVVSPGPTTQQQPMSDVAESTSKDFNEAAYGSNANLVPALPGAAKPVEPKAKKVKSGRKSTGKEHNKSASATPAATPGTQIEKKKPRAKPKKAKADDYLSPLRIRMPDFKPGEISSNPRLPLFLMPATYFSPATGQNVEVFLTDDHPFNRRGFKYVPCEACPDLPTIKYRQIEMPPYRSRVNYEDMSMQIMVDRETATIVSTDKGYRTARANVAAREGKWYWECKVLKGNCSADDGNVRAGWSRREASLETPVGMDAYGYGIRDVTGQKMHISRGMDFMKEPFKAGDVIGFYISLPSITNQLSAGSTKSASKLKTMRNEAVSNVVRDRIPIKYKGQLYFEQFECVPTKEFQDMLNQSSSDDVSERERQLREKGLPKSSIKVYKNGKYFGTPFEYLLPFLPPHSVPLSTLGARVVDDGALGYYPSISVYNGAVAQFNFGPDFDCFPSDLMREARLPDISKRVRPMCERYDEQLAEDVVWDVIDEVDLSMNGDDTTLDDVAAIGR